MIAVIYVVLYHRGSSQCYYILLYLNYTELLMKVYVTETSKSIYEKFLAILS